MQAPRKPKRRGGSVLRFKGEYLFLSNFFWSDLEFEGLTYPSVEHAFQAAKLLTNAERQAHGFLSRDVTFGQAKRKGRNVQLRADWSDVKEQVMMECLSSKFSADKLRRKLLGTQKMKLIDGHDGSPDIYWGFHIPSNKGANRLGLILMDLRQQLGQQLPTKANKSKPVGEASVGLPDARENNTTKNTDNDNAVFACLFHLDWPVKCLLDGLPPKYQSRIFNLATTCGILSGSVIVLPKRKICIAMVASGDHPHDFLGRFVIMSDVVYGGCIIIIIHSGHALMSWEHAMRTEMVDVNSKG